MSSLAAGAGAGKAGADTAGGGAGGGENNLAFKVKRKRMVIETLNLNVDAVDANEKKGGEAAGSEALQPAPRVSPQTVHKPTQVSEPSSQSKPPPASEAHLTPAPRQSGSLSSPVAAPAKPAFSGLKSLRERGMQMKKGPASGPSATAPDHLEIDGSTSEEPQGQQRKAKHIPPGLHAGGDLQNLDF
jgi:elongator complex protein 4